MLEDLFILRKEHDDAFGQAGLRRFQRRAVSLLLKRHPEANIQLTPITLQAKVDSWLVMAREHGLLSEIALFTFYEAGLLLWLCGEAIEVDKTTQSILDRRDFNPEARAELVRKNAAGAFHR